MAVERELEENFSPEEISSNPELVKRFKELYDIVKRNAHQNLSDKNQKNMVQKDAQAAVEHRPPVANLNPNAKINNKKNKTNINDSNKNEDLESTLKSNNSLRSNVDIREVYSMVKTLTGKSNNDEKSDDDYEKIHEDEDRDDDEDLDEKAHTLKKNDYSKFRLPSSLCDKINTLVTPYLKNTAESESNSNHKILIHHNQQQQQQNNAKLNSSILIDDDDSFSNTKNFGLNTKFLFNVSEKKLHV
jgi:hypothetical protein